MLQIDNYPCFFTCYVLSLLLLQPQSAVLQGPAPVLHVSHAAVPHVQAISFLFSVKIVLDLLLLHIYPLFCVTAILFILPIPRGWTSASLLLPQWELTLSSLLLLSCSRATPLMLHLLAFPSITPSLEGGLLIMAAITRAPGQGWELYLMFLLCNVRFSYFSTIFPLTFMKLLTVLNPGVWKIETLIWVFYDLLCMQWPGLLMLVFWFIQGLCSTYF